MPLSSFIGLPGSGKSTVGRHVARAFDLRFVDSDGVIEQRIGGSIRALFENEGEARFRDIEELVIADLSKEPDCVLATGGGTVLRESNRQALRAGSVVVYLRAGPEALFQRVRHDHRRPLLQVADPLQRLWELHDQRDRLYCETAHVVVESSGSAIEKTVASVLASLRTRVQATGHPNRSAS